jgi:hypothetical protein
MSVRKTLVKWVEREIYDQGKTKKLSCLSILSWKPLCYC